MPSTEEDAVPPPGRLRRLGAWLGLCALASCHTPPPQAARAPVLAPRAVPSPMLAPHSRPAQTADEYQRQIAARLIAANPSRTYLTPAPSPLLAIPVLELQVNANGSVHHIGVIRTPSQATDTIQIAIDALRRAAPFGDASHLPRPWTFTEVFLFDEDRRFKPRILD